jgi:hypothetical protein
MVTRPVNRLTYSRAKEPGGPGNEQMDGVRVCDEAFLITTFVFGS